MTGWDIFLLAGSALLVGLGKTALPAIVTIPVAVLASVLPARQSTAVMLLLLLLGDCIATAMYRRQADWRMLRALLPSVGLGVLLGAAFLYVADDAMMRRTIGIVLIALTLLTVLMMRVVSPERLAARFKSRFVRSSYGCLGGATTMAANAGGPVMHLYLLSSGLDKATFLGTQAWFFFIVNIIKLPFSAGIGLFAGDTLTIALACAPGVIVGALAGVILARCIKQEHFTMVIIVFTLVSSAFLIV